jgi:hypothetical protein
MILVHLPYGSNARHHMLVAQMASKRVARIGRVNDNSPGSHDGNGLPYQAQLRVIGMNGKELSQVGKLFSF